MTRRILVTGATGFVGRALCERLTQRGVCVRAATRTPASAVHSAAEVCVVGEIGAQTDWQRALSGVDCVLHLAARAHVMSSVAAADELYQEVNARGTARLAAAAAAAGITRFMYLSSVKVNGEGGADVSYSASDEPRPQDPYGRSKWQGEQELRRAAAHSAMEFVIVRAPLVYGAGVRANFLRLMRWVDRGTPLPFGAIHNRRSLISVWNLADALQFLVEHPAAGENVWMVADDADVSTPELIQALGRALQCQPRLFNVPPAILSLLARLSGRSAELQRLCGSLRVDSRPIREQLRWQAPLTLAAGLERTAAWYRAAAT
jgi:nucleoside-diphosphate-sugar epimerase